MRQMEVQFRSNKMYLSIYFFLKCDLNCGLVDL